MEKALETLKATMVADYERWQTVGGKTRTEIQAQMLDDYINGITFEEGSKYIKVTTTNGGGPGRSVWGFVVKTENDKKFQKGDILMAAGWATPARNKARGNVNTDLSWVRWTGPAYL